jgi:hypothetical protein
LIFEKQKPPRAYMHEIGAWANSPSVQNDFSTSL